MKLVQGGGRRNNMRLWLALALGVSLCAQDSKETKDKDAKDQVRFGTTVNVVSVPVTVVGPDDRYVDGLEKQHFRVFDNNKEQEIMGFDVSFLPVSLVLCVESSARVEALLPQIKKTAVLYSEMLVGEQGEAAVIQFDHRVEVLQEFTKDSDQFKAALQKIRVGSDATRMADAVWRAIRLLRSRPDNNRKVIVLVSESRENGSETDLGESLRDAQLGNVLIYSIQLSTVKARVLRTPDARRDPLPPGVGVSARPSIPGTAGTPTQQAQSRVQVTPNVIPMVIEAVRGVKNLLFNDPLQLLTEGTGGRRTLSLTQESMEETIRRIGEELRSQYLLTYRPNNLQQGGFHEIRVDLTMDGLKVRTRPGYWLGPVAGQ
jgi:VWFA-related protein